MSKQWTASSRQTARQRASGRPRRSPWVWLGGGLFALILVAGGVWLATRSTSASAPGQRFPIQGQQHITPSQTHPAYNSDPPTSGWHYDTPLASGFHEQSVADEQMVHNLEHGHVVISYDCSKLADCAATKTQIRQLVERYRNWKVTAVPRQNADAAIALTAWGWLDKLDGFDDARITAFVNAWRDRGPERTED
jgi:transposase